MIPGGDQLFSTQISGEPMPDAGLFTWDLKSNLVYADSALASLFGLEPDETEHGLPLQSYMERIHPQDAPALAKQINDAIVAQHPTVQNYRVLSQDGTYIPVCAFGRCFRDRDDVPVHYAGIVVPADTLPDNRSH
ncbi:PAS fold-containing protein [Rhizobium tibeticum]|uniref:PAS fold-containing protein n=1 Tax=Rhizobium tibeticum TaxID=501024 RepID=A0A1H8L6S2_9HYPH|nr:PAS domain-containing protein [Rhizobium tibeticum]SEH86698.1 putative diguanylate cyclase [Rhizobium tibeticum]SEO00795.1 PAS fold-containing protein [Rhizobium tibeticum]